MGDGGVQLRVSGRLFGGWKSARVVRSIESFAGVFELELGGGATIVEDEVCTLLYNGVPLVTGFVEATEESISSGDHSLRVSGRDRTGDLLDSSYLGPPWAFARAPVERVAATIAAPFGVSVALQPGVTAEVPQRVAVDPGETAYEVIERVCRLAAVLPTATATGGILLTRAGAVRAATALVLGRNVLSLSVSRNRSGLFARYVVRGQEADSHRAASAEARDVTVPRSARALLVRPEGAVTIRTARTRAQWEVAVRRGRATRATASVLGWAQEDGTLWEPNRLVRVDAAKLRLPGEMLIVECTYELSAQAGLTTSLSLALPDAFLVDPGGARG